MLSISTVLPSQCQDYGHGHWADALITGAHLSNVTLRGGGTIDGNGNLHESCVAGNAVPAAASHVDPRGPTFTVGNATLLPGCKLFSLVNTTGVTVAGLTFRDGGWFSLLFTDVARVHLADLEIEPARDGIDLVGCRDVLAERLSIRGGNDDAFALKSDWSVGARIDTSNITLRDSTLASNGCNCINVGLSLLPIEIPSSLALDSVVLPLILPRFCHVCLLRAPHPPSMLRRCVFSHTLAGGCCHLRWDAVWERDVGELPRHPL